MASQTECARRYAYAEPCRRCGGSGRETEHMPPPWLAWMLSWIVVSGGLAGAYFLLRWLA